MKLLSKFALTVALVAGITAAAQAQLSLTDSSTSYLINFDSTIAGVSNGAWAGTGFQAVPVAGQLDSDAWAVTGWTEGDLAFGGTRTTAATDYTRGAATAAVGTGGMYAFSGGNITTGVALGFQPGGSDWALGTITLRIQNNTSSVLSSLDVSYLLYVRNDQGRANSFNFSFSLDNAAYTAVPGLNLTSGEAVDALGFVSNSRSTTLSSLTVAPGSSIYLRWNGADVSGAGNRDEFALDNINLTYSVVPEPSVYMLLGVGLLFCGQRYLRRRRA